MPRKEDRTAASHAAATRPAHHWPATPKPVPNSPEYSSLVPPSCPVSTNCPVMCGTGSVALKVSAEGNTRLYKAVKTAISLPDDTYEQATRRAAEPGISRSEFFARAARRYLDELASGSLVRQINEALQTSDDDSSAAAAAAGRNYLAAQHDW
jgi:antitoxin MazE6